MKRGYLLVFLCLFLKQSFCQMIIGKPLPEIYKAGLTDSTISLLTSSAQFDEARIVVIDSVIYEVVFKKSGVIKFVSTGDEKFRSSEGLSIGSSYIEVRKIFGINKVAIINIPGWGKYIKLQSGWNAVFDFKAPVDEKSKIQFFFKSE